MEDSTNKMKSIKSCLILNPEKENQNVPERLKAYDAAFCKNVKQVLQARKNILFALVDFINIIQKNTAFELEEIIEEDIAHIDNFLTELHSDDYKFNEMRKEYKKVGIDLNFTTDDGEYILYMTDGYEEYGVQQFSLDGDKIIIKNKLLSQIGIDVTINQHE